MASVDQQSLEAVQVRGVWLPQEVHRPQQSEETHQEPQQGGAGAGQDGEGEPQGEEGPAECGGGGQPGDELGNGGTGDDEPLPCWEPEPDVRRRPRHHGLDQEGGGGEILPVLRCSSLPRGLMSQLNNQTFFI